MKRSIQFLLNDSVQCIALPPGRVVLDFLRQDRRLTGTREGCREGDCGACMVLLGELGEGGVRYRTVNSCLLPLGDLQGRHLITIEGLNPPSPQSPALNPIQKAIVENGATQCGFCTPGFVVALTGFFLSSAPLGVEPALDAVAGNICRCTGYASIRRAIRKLVDEFRTSSGGDGERLERCVDWGIAPAWLREAQVHLQEIRRQTAAEEGVRKAVFVAGGTDLFVQKPDQLQKEPLEFLSGRSGFAGVWQREGRQFLGAATPFEDLREVQPLGAYLEWIASAPIRHRATVGGNIVNASPIGDLSILLLALGASLGLRGPSGTRELALDRFFLGYKKLDLSAGEVLEWIAFPAFHSDLSFSFEKVGRRKHLDIASVNSAACLRLQGKTIAEARLSAGGVAPVPLLLQNTSKFLSGRKAAIPELRQALRAAQEEISPISDVRGSADYKRLLLRQLLVAHFLRLLPAAVSPETAKELL